MCGCGRSESSDRAIQPPGNPGLQQQKPERTRKGEAEWEGRVAACPVLASQKPLTTVNLLPRSVAMKPRIALGWEGQGEVYDTSVEGACSAVLSVCCGWCVKAVPAHQLIIKRHPVFCTGSVTYVCTESEELQEECTIIGKFLMGISTPLLSLPLSPFTPSPLFFFPSSFSSFLPGIS